MMRAALLGCTIGIWMTGCADASGVATGNEATAAGPGAPAPVTVTGAPLALTGVRFGVIDAKGQEAGTATVTNVSDEGVDVGAITLAGDRFAIADSGCAGVLAAGASCEVTIVFTPVEIGRWSGSISVAPGGVVVSAPLDGVGAAPLGLTIEAGRGAIRAAGQDLVCTDACTTLVVAPVTLVPAADDGWFFAGWTGVCSGDGACVVPPELAARGVGAIFTPYAVTR